MPNGHGETSGDYAMAAVTDLQKEINTLKEREDVILRTLGAHNESFKVVHDSIKLLTDGLGLLTQTVSGLINENR